MKTLIKFPSIDQFRTVVKNIKSSSEYIGKDANGEPMYNSVKTKPTLTFKGTVKLHGTNAAVCYTNCVGLWVQSRENIIESGKNDNAGCASAVEQNKSQWLKIIAELAKRYSIDLDQNIISIYYEWAGKGIQKGVAISELDKAAYIFSYFRVTPHNAEKPSIWLSTNNINDKENNIFNIEDFKTYSIKIDFNEPERIQNDLNILTLEVEDECPVANALGIKGVGEGIVWEAIYEDTKYTFKVKGEKHSKSPVKTLNPVDLEKLDKIDKCVEQITSTTRFNQALTEVFGIDFEKTIDIKKIGDYLRWVGQDTIKEEADIIAEHGFEPKDVMGKVQQKAKMYFNEVLKLAVS